MFPKLATVILAIGVCACALLAMRQSRLQAASEVAQAQLRISTLDEQLWLLRARIAENVTPIHVEQMAAGLGPLGPARPVTISELEKQAPGKALASTSGH